MKPSAQTLSAAGVFVTLAGAFSPRQPFKGILVGGSPALGLPAVLSGRRPLALQVPARLKASQKPPKGLKRVWEATLEQLPRLNCLKGPWSSKEGRSRHSLQGGQGQSLPWSRWRSTYSQKERGGGRV